MTALPLAIGAADPRKLEKAMREYNGKPLVGPVSEGSAEQVFPLIRKYGGVAVCLTEKENGAPQEPEERVCAAEAIAKKAGEYGIAPKDLIIDPLEEADAGGAGKALAAMKVIRSTIGIRTSFGASGRIRVTADLVGQKGSDHPDMVFADPAEDALTDALMR